MTDTTQDPFAAPPDAAQPEASLRAMPDFTSLSLHKVALIAGLAIATIVPNMLISNLVEEREQRQSGVRAGVHAQLGPGADRARTRAGDPVSGGRAAAHLRADRGGASSILRRRSIRRSAGAACSARQSTMQRSTCRRIRCAAEARLREFVSDKDGRFIWNEAAIAFGTRSRLTGLSVDRQHHGRRHAEPRGCRASKRCAGAACKGADMVLAKAPLAARQ